MIAQEVHYLHEEDARKKIEISVDKLSEERSLGKETRTGDDTSSIDYHIDNIKKAGGGRWNETIAKDYIQNLESQVIQETDAPGPPA